MHKSSNRYLFDNSKRKEIFCIFTIFKKHKICFFLEINRKFNSIENITANICSFDKILTSGREQYFMELYLISIKKFFNIENIYFSKVIL